jgi:predicted nuclease of restriction endonuclease-like RecB superfamily
VPAGRTLIFPDFLVRHRLCPQRRFLVEILGFWSADYLVRKLALLREAGLPNLILCVDEARGDDLPLPDARIVRFRRRIDPRLVLAAAGEKCEGLIEKRPHDPECRKSNRRSAP